MDSSGLDSYLFTNGTMDAYVEVPAQIVRFRLLNGSSERSFNVGLENHSEFYVIGTDGGLLQEPVELDELLMSPGERYEILVDLNNMNGDTISVMNYGSTIPDGVYGAETVGGMGGSSIPYYADNPLNGNDFTLLELYIISPTDNPITSIPTSLVTVFPWNPDDVDETRIIQFSPVNMGPDGALNGPFQFNGQPFDINVINYEIPLDNVEIWELQNQSQIAHPFHIHDVQFNILEIDGQTPPIHMQGWKDVVLVPPQNGTAKFITKFEDYSDTSVPYMYHCHILTHEETGMMGQFIVIDSSSAGIDELLSLPTDLTLYNAYPNPFNPLTTIRFTVGIQSAASLKIFDITGQLVDTLVDDQIEPGTHETQWNGSNQPSGVYFAVLQSGNNVQTQKVILLK